MAQQTVTLKVRVRWPLLCAVLCVCGLRRLGLWLCVKTKVAP